ncbi:MAG: DMT family transporter [Kiritimatiellae bacterium]|nr:DMT family transporter [Kiritimatiellia bacterium]
MTTRGSECRFDTTAAFALVGALVGWCIGPIFIKYLTITFDSWSQNFYRYAAASVVWLPWLFLAHRRGSFDRAVWKRALAPAGWNVIMQCAWARAYYYLDPAFMAVLVKTSVLMIAGFSMLLLPEERLLLRSWHIYAGFILASAGVTGVLLSGTPVPIRGKWIGIALTMVSSVTWALYVVSARIAFRNTDSRHGFAVTSLYTFFGLGVAYAIFAQPVRSLPRHIWPWACIVISGVTAIAIAHVCYYAAMRRIGATIPAIVILSTPFFILALSHAFFGETMTRAQCAWGLVLLTGAGLATLAQRNLRLIPKDETTSPD